MGTSDGNIIATIMTIHMPRNDSAAAVQVCPGIRIQTIDMVHPPGIGISPMADMDLHHQIVIATLLTNSTAETAKKPRWEIREETVARHHCPTSVLIFCSLSLPRFPFGTRLHQRWISVPTSG